ncbi:MAG: hypothetical protein WAO20_22400 [Acidobacteriota bacterium]
MKRLDLFLILFLLLPAAGAARAGSVNGRSETVVFVETRAKALTGLSADPEGTLRSDLCDGARLVIRERDGRRRVLSRDFQSACEPDVSFDATHILFAGRKRADQPYDIFEIGVDGRDLRQITRDAGNCRQPRYLSTYYVITANEPWLQILFVSDAAGEINEKGNRPATDLYSCRIDGSEVRRVTYNPSADQDPFLMWDGRILFAGWQAALPRHGGRGRMRIFDMNVDGTDLAAFTGEQGRRVQQMPTVTTDGLAIFVEADETSPDGGGQLGSVELRRNFHSYRSLTQPADGFFHSPSPLADGSLLVSWRPATGPGNYALCRFDPASGRREPFYAEPGRDLLEGRLVSPRPRPDGRSSVVNDTHPYGQFYGLDIGINDLENPDWLTPATARRLRVIEGLPRHASAEAAETRSPYLPRRILGEVPIQGDGSFFFEIPANLPVQLQLIDENGMALRSCGWIWVRNKEPRGCIGCHEDGELTPPNRLVEAVKGPPVRLTLPERQRRFVDFDRDVLPVVARGCGAVSCHDGTPGRLSLQPPAAGAQASEYGRSVYDALAEGLGRGDDPMRGRWIHPGEARTSPLIWHVTGQRTSRPWDPVPAHPERIPVGGKALLTPDQIRVLIEWIDLGAQGGSRVEQAARAAVHSDPSGAIE